MMIKLMSLMSVVFNDEMRWELIPYQLRPMSLVRVKDGSKRMREPRVVSVDEFLRISERIPEPFRTMCIVAMWMGFRVSEILGLKWCDVDWESMRIGIRESNVYGKPGSVKTPASQRWMPLDPSLANKLRQHQLRCASPANKQDWVFANPNTGKPLKHTPLIQLSLSASRRIRALPGAAESEVRKRSLRLLSACPRISKSESSANLRSRASCPSISKTLKT